MLYNNNSSNPKNKTLLYSISSNKSTLLLLIGFMLLILIYFDEGAHEFLEKELAYHMVFEHGLFFFIGVLSIKLSENFLKMARRYSQKEKSSLLGEEREERKNHKVKSILFMLSVKWSNVLRSIFKIKNMAYILIFTTIVLLGFWHIPSVFDSAVLNEILHRLQHISFIIVGALGFLFIRLVGDSYKIFLLFILGCMMGSMGIIFSLIHEPIFLVYSVSDHNYAGLYMVSTGLLILLLALPIYIIRKTLSYVKTRM